MTAIGMRTKVEAAASFLPLMVWTSPAFPIGAYAYSHGLEHAVETGRVGNASGLEDWLKDLLRHGAPRNDAILGAAAYGASAPSARPGAERRSEGTRTAQPAAGDEGTFSADRVLPSPRSVLAGEMPAIADVNALALAMASSRERYLETSAQGNAFVAVARAAWPCAALDELIARVPGDVAYPVALATAAAGHALPLSATLEAMLLGFVANFVSAGQRLGCIGQTGAQLVVARLLGDVREAAVEAAGSTLEDLGAAAFQSDLAALAHETQYSRLFRS